MNAPSTTISCAANPVRPIAPAIFIGWQERVKASPMSLFRLTEAIPGHPVHSAVSAITLIDAGFSLPPCWDKKK
jgi:hypothetical protein